MNLSTKIALGFVGTMSTVSFLMIPPVKPSTNLKGYKQLAVKKIVSKKNIRSGSTGRTYSGGGSSYGK